MADPTIAQLVDAVGLKSTDDVIKTLTVALRGDRKKLQGLVKKARGKITTVARARVDKELKSALGKVRGAKKTTKAATAKAKAKAATPLAITGAKLGPRQALPLSLQQVMRMKAVPGRRVRVQQQGPADRRELIALARSTDTNARRSFAAIRHNARSVEALARAQRKMAANQRELARAVAELQSRGDVAMYEGLLSAIGKVDIGLGKCKKKIDLNAKKQRDMIDAKVGQLQGQLKDMLGATRIQKLNDAATAMQTAAFGTKGDLLDRNNLMIAGNHVVWGLLSDVLKTLGFAEPGLNALEWLTPVVSLAASQLSLGGRQHERFISGVADRFQTTTFLAAEQAISLQPFVAPDLWPEFQERTDVVVTLTAIEVPDLTTLTAQVVGGVLTITAEVSNAAPSGGPPANTSRVSWVVDTQVPR